MAPLSSNPKSSTISRARVVSQQAPRLRTNKTFTFWRQRLRRRAQGKRVLTAGDRFLQAKKREQYRQNYRNALREAQGKIYALAQELKDRFGKYSVDHYHNDLIHRAHKSRSTRKVNRWNAFQRLELKRMKGVQTVKINSTYQKLSYVLAENPDSVNLTAATKEISARWKLLSEEDRVAITAGCMQEIEEEREVKDLALHNVPLQAFYDARRTVQTVEKDVSRAKSDDI